MMNKMVGVPLVGTRKTILTSIITSHTVPKHGILAKWRVLKMIHPPGGESEFRGGHGACHGELSAEGEKFLREHLHPDYFLDQNGSFLRKPSPPNYITYQEPEYDKKNQIFSKIPRNRSLARYNCWAIRCFSVWLSSSMGSANSSAARACRDSLSQ